MLQNDITKVYQSEITNEITTGKTNEEKVIWYKIPLSYNEKSVIQKLADKNRWTEYELKRRSDREYDIEIEGKYKLSTGEYMFGSYLPLEIIHSVKWARKKIWRYQDGYGEAGFMPVQGYDWSGIRDSSDVAIQKMMKIALKELMNS